MTRYSTPTALCLVLTCLLASACNLIDYHPYDVRISGKTDINARHIAEIEQQCQGKDTIRFASIGDSQRWYDETEDLVAHLNQRGDIDFVVHNGDLSDFGVTDEFMWQRDILEGLHMPYVALIGNHDCLGTGEEAFVQIFGPTNFSFIAGQVKFVCLNTNALEHDYSQPIPDFEFIESELAADSGQYSKTVVCMHVRPYAQGFNDNVARAFQRYLTSFPGLQFCTAAHEHKCFEMDIFGDGIIYYMSDCMKHRNYYLFTITPDGYEKEVVYF